MWVHAQSVQGKFPCSGQKSSTNSPALHRTGVFINFWDQRSEVRCQTASDRGTLPSLRCGIVRSALTSPVLGACPKNGPCSARVTDFHRQVRTGERPKTGLTEPVSVPAAGSKQVVDRHRPLPAPWSTLSHAPRAGISWSGKVSCTDNHHKNRCNRFGTMIRNALSFKRTCRQT